MAGTISRFISALVLLGLSFLVTLDFTVAQTGVCYGRLGNNMPSPSKVVALCNQYNIRRMRIYDPDQPTLQALGGSNIEVVVGVPNTDLQHVAASQDNANTWVQNNIKNHPDVKFRYIVAGNEVSPLKPDTAQYVNFVLPAMRNINNAISAAGLGNQIKVSTSIDMGVLEKSYPPADGVFRSDVLGYLDPIIRFLVENDGPLLVSIYPYFSYTDNKAQIDLQYALFTSDGVVVPGGVRYQNLFYALVDAMYAALEKRVASSLALTTHSPPVVPSETGWPTNGGDSASIHNAETFNTNLIRYVRDGTPKRPGQPIETYIFDLFDENQKQGPAIERNFGIFRPDGQPKYPISF